MKAEERAICVRHRLNKAQECAEEARILIESGHLRGAVNRIYYGMFHAVSALALAHGFTTSKHSQLRGYFNREFVKTGRVARELGEAFSKASENRSKADYADLVDFDPAQVRRAHARMVEFVRVMTQLAVRAITKPDDG